MPSHGDFRRFVSLVGWGVALSGLAACEASPQATADESAKVHWPIAESAPAGWKRIQVGQAFSFEAPIETQPVLLPRGIDSAVGGYRTDRFSFTFDYGPYSNSLSDSTPWRVIDGHKARLESGRGPCQTPPTIQKIWPFAGNVYVELRPNPERLALTMAGCASSEIGLAELRQIYLSLRFNPKTIGD
jgi:hypothetical protein